MDFPRLSTLLQNITANERHTNVNQSSDNNEVSRRSLPRIHGYSVAYAAGRQLYHLKDKPLDLAKVAMSIAIYEYFSSYLYLSFLRLLITGLCLQIMFLKGWIYRNISIDTVLLAEKDRAFDMASLPQDVLRSVLCSQLIQILINLALKFE